MSDSKNKFFINEIELKKVMKELPDPNNYAGDLFKMVWMDFNNFKISPEMRKEPKRLDSRELHFHKKCHSGGYKWLLKSPYTALLEDGQTYLFNHNGNTYFGKYEALSGNFFVGGDETHQKHTHYFEAAACESIEYSAF